MQSEIMVELEGMQNDELQEVLQLIRAKKATYHQPLAFIQEMMQFQAIGTQDGRYLFDMSVRSETLNRYGILHGGLMTAFIDTAMAETAFLIDPDVERAFTLNITVDFIRPGLIDDTLHAEVEVIQNSRVIIVFHTKVYNSKGEIIAMAMAHFYKQHRRTSSDESTASDIAHSTTFAVEHSSVRQPSTHQA